MRLQIDKRKLDQARTKKGFKSRRALYVAAGWEDRELHLNGRLKRSGGWQPEEVDKIASLLSCKPEKLLISPKHTAGGISNLRENSLEGLSPLKLISTTDIESAYLTLAEDTFVWIFSADGFIEAENISFFRVVASALGKGAEIFYFFPYLSEIQVSRAAYQKILERLVDSDLGDAAERARAFYILPKGSFLHAHSSRFVISGRVGKGKRYFDRVMLYLGQPGGLWIEMDQLNHEEFLARMLEAIDPVQYRPPRFWRPSWRLPTLIKSPYQTSFNRLGDAHSYGIIRDLAQTKDGVLKLARRVVHTVSQSRELMAKPSLSWLDVGCEDGENTAVAYEEFRKSDLRVSLTAIDTSHQTDVNKLLEYSAFLNGSEWAFEKFSTDIPRDVRFDIITSVHSWYLIDLSYLIDMYRILSEEGVAAFVLAPLESNIINQITCHVDRYIRKKFKAKASPYKEKVAALDPYRNYAEDLAFSCYQFFGEDGVHLVKRRGHIKTERLITKGGELTPEAKAVADFFAHRMTLLDDDVYDQIGAIILEHDSGGRVGCDEWEIVLDKARIMSSKREMMVSATLETTLATK